MTLVFDPAALPPPLRGKVEAALREREGHEHAIEAIETHLAEGGERTADLLIALATVVYDDAASVVLHRLAEASIEALRLLDEAAIARGTAHGLGPLRATFEASRDRELDRERRARLLMVAPERARPTELAELAHRLLMRGEDSVAALLMREACGQLEVEDGAEPERMVG